jgi:Zn-dependent peptidase ImmA (M78 family)/transcriptional regulator with XRE-family HTH domain
MPANHNMLRLARQRRGLQQIEAAVRLSIDQSVLSRMENGVGEIRDEIVLRASSAYGFPISFFYQTDPVYGAPVSVHPMWRKKADVTVREIDGVVAELNLRIMHLRRLLDGADVAHSNDLPRMDIEEFGSPERVAAMVRAHWKIPRGPLPDLTLLAEKAGVLVVHSGLGGASVSGVTFSAPGISPLIVLNTDQPSDRMRFTLAHELGHLIMHRFPSAAMEDEANKFASALLMPPTDVRPYFVGRRVDLSLLASLKPEWKVSMGALLMAADHHGFLTSNQKQYLWKQMSGRGYRLREPPELDLPYEKPSVVESLLDVHRGSLGYSFAELAGLLNSFESDLRELYPANDLEPSRPKLTILK